MNFKIKNVEQLCRFWWGEIAANEYLYLFSGIHVDPFGFITQLKLELNGFEVCESQFLGDDSLIVRILAPKKLSRKARNCFTELASESGVFDFLNKIGFENHYGSYRFEETDKKTAEFSAFYLEQVKGFDVELNKIAQDGTWELFVGAPWWQPGV